MGRLVPTPPRLPRSREHEWEGTQTGIEQKGTKGTKVGQDWFIEDWLARNIFGACALAAFGVVGLVLLFLML